MQALKRLFGISVFTFALFASSAFAQTQAAPPAATPAPAITPAPAPKPDKFETTVTFVLFNDIYEMGERTGADGKKRGGFARLATVVKNERAKNKNVFVAHGGDTLSPSLMSSIDGGAHIVALTNMIGIDALAPGNHEFDAGKDNFFAQMTAAKFPIYGANLRNADGSQLPFIKDRSILEFDGVKIGITGAILDNTPKVSSSGDLKFSSLVDTTKEQANLLRKEGADFVVAIMHATRGDSLLLQSDAVANLYLTGHTHDLYIGFDELSAIVESSSDAHYVTAIDAHIIVTMKDGKKQVRWWPQFRVIDTASVEPDPEVAAEVKKYQDKLAAELEIPIGKTDIELDSRTATVRSGEAAIGNLIADAIRDALAADIAIMNGGGIRAGKLYAAGTTISRKDIVAEMPFGNKITLLGLKGADVKKALEHALYNLPEPTGRFPQVSGMEVRYDVTKPPGSRLISVTLNGAPIDDAKDYKLATNDFLSRGGDGFEVLKNAKRLMLDESDAPLLADTVMAYVKKLGAVSTPVSGRIRNQ